jgi:hypothetical protein
MNLLTQVLTRNALVNTGMISKIMDDPRVYNSQVYGMRANGSAVRVLNNIEGFNEVREFPAMPDGNVTVGTFTANASTEVCTVGSTALSTSIYPLLSNGDRIRLTSTGTLPAGLSLATDYYAINVNAAADTFQISTSPSGSAINITDTGSGTHTVTRFENLNGLAFEKRAIQIAVRPLIDNVQTAVALGINPGMVVKTETDPESGLSFTYFIWGDFNGTNPTTDIFVTITCAFGIIAGRQMAVGQGSFPLGTAPATLAAGTAMDYAAQRIVELANTNG